MHRTILLAVVGFALVGSTAAQAVVGTGHGNAARRAALKAAENAYNKAQKKCANKDLGEMPKIISLAKKIKQLGGPSISKTELYRCAKFTFQFLDGIGVYGSGSDPDTMTSYNWNFEWLLTSATDAKMTLDQADSTKQYLYFTVEAPASLTGTGHSTSTSPGGSCTFTQQTSKVASTVTGVLQFYPRAPKTSKLYVNPGPGNESYDEEGASCDQTGQQSGYTYAGFFSYLHRSENASEGGCEGYNLKADINTSGRSFASDQFGASTAISPETPRLIGCQGGYSELQSGNSTVNPTDEGSAVVHHDPSAWHGHHFK